MEKFDQQISRPEMATREKGFSLIEVVIALVILMVAVTGIFAMFAYATQYNTGNSRRSQALSVLKQEVELLRSAKFTPATVDTATNTATGQRDITGGAKTTRTVTAVDGTLYRVETVIDDDPFAANVQVAANVTTPTLKQITVTVTPETGANTWETAVPARAVFRRVRAN